MSQQDAPKPRKPTCPVCMTDDRVITLDPPEFRPGSPMTEDSPSWPFDCANCGTVFTGTDDEYVRLYRRRDLWKKQHPTRPKETR